MITDPAGTVIARYDYTPFGQPWNPPGTVEPMQFTGKEHDLQTELDYFNARDLMSLTGRFTTADPGHINGNVEDPQSWNAYAYARNNPFVYADPSGTEYQMCAFGGGDFPGSCGWISNSSFYELLNHPGGFRLSGGWIYSGNNRVGSYRVAGFGDWAQLTWALSSRWLREQSTEMAKGAVLSAATFGVGLAVRAGVEVIMAARLPIVSFKIGAANMAALSSAGIDVAKAKDAASLLIQSKLLKVPAVGTRIEGSVDLNGRLLKVTAGVNAAGEIVVGSIRVIR